MTITEANVVGEVVATDYRAATIFKAHKIDFCCNGNRTISDVCAGKDLRPDQLIDELEKAISTKEKQTADFQSWDADLLADYIEKKHHRYVAEKIPELRFYLKKVAKVHGLLHPELIKIEQLFLDSSYELLAHMKKEEMILFPFVRAVADKPSTPQAPFGSVQNPIRMMMHEHDTEGERFRKIAELSDNYTPPADACTTYKVAFAMLQEFEEDLHLHIHLENNILFPKALASESQMN